MTTLLKWIMFSLITFIIIFLALSHTNTVLNNEWRLESSSQKFLQDSLLTEGYLPKVNMRLRSTMFPFVYKWNTGAFCNEARGKCFISPFGNFKPFGQFSWNCMGCPEVPVKAFSSYTGCGDILSDLLLNAKRINLKQKNKLILYGEDWNMTYRNFSGK